MNTRYILTFMSVMMMLGLQGCSDNYDIDNKPIVGERTLLLDEHDGAFSLNCGAEPKTYEIQVESNTLWKVDVNCTGGWCSVDKMSGRGSEPFGIVLRDNMLEKRTCSVMVYTVNAAGDAIPSEQGGKSITITVSQESSDVRLSPSSVAPLKPSENELLHFNIIANVEWTLDVSYEDDNGAKFITIKPESGMQEVGDGTYKGNADASFNISVADNRTAMARTAYLNLRGSTSTSVYTVELTQSKADYTFDVSPLGNQVIAAKGDDINFSVYSSVSDWKIVPSQEDMPSWIKFTKMSGEMSDNSVTTVATIAPNLTSEERQITVYFQPLQTQYEGLSVTITQRAFDFTFTMSSQGAHEIVSEKGGSLSFDLDSRFDWRLETPSWISANMVNGSSSSSSRVINLTVEPNAANSDRNGTIYVYPQSTVFDTVTVDPQNANVQPISFSVTQYGGHAPAISQPWVMDGYTQTSAIVEFNYYSPFVDIVEAALQWKKEDAPESDWNSVNASVSDPIAGKVTVELTGLDPATRYVARGYVRPILGEPNTGIATYPFTTAGQYPGSGHNPTPSK